MGFFKNKIKKNSGENEKDKKVFIPENFEWDMKILEMVVKLDGKIKNFLTDYGDISQNCPKAKKEFEKIKKIEDDVQKISNKLTDMFHESANSERQAKIIDGKRAKVINEINTVYDKYKKCKENIAKYSTEYVEKRKPLIL